MRGGTRQAGNGTAKTRRTDQWADSLIEHGSSPLWNPWLSDCFLWGSVAAACNRVARSFVEGFEAAHDPRTRAEVRSDARFVSTLDHQRKQMMQGCLRRGGTRQAGNGTAKTRRTNQWADSLIEHGPSPLWNPWLFDCFLWGSVAAACNRAALKEVKGFHDPHDLGQVC
jgi:hypothetical protein